MTHYTRIALIDPDEATAAALVATLDAHGCATVALGPDTRDMRETLDAPGLRADVIVVNAARTPGPSIALARRLRERAGHGATPILVLGGAPEPEAGTKAGAGNGIESVIGAPFADAALVSRVRGLARLSVMQTELRRRQAIERRYGIEDKPASPDDGATPPEPAAVLAVGDFGAAAGTVAAAGDATLRITFAAERTAALETLYEGGYDLAVVAIDPAPEEALAWCDAVRDNPRLFNLPILMIGAPDAFDEPDRVYDRGFADLLPSPSDARDFGAHLRMLLRQQRYRRLLREAYRSPLRRETADGLTGLYGFGFLHEYLASLIAETEATGGTFTVALYDIERLADITAAQARPLNTSSGKPVDGLQVSAEQIGMFDASFRLQRVRGLRSAAVQHVVGEPVELRRNLTGWAASGVVGQNRARWIPLLQTFDRYDRPRGAAAALLLNYAGYYSGSCWAYFGVENVDLFEQPTGPMARTLQRVARFLLNKTFLHNLATDRRLYRPGEPVAVSVVVDNRSTRPQRVSVRFSLRPAGTGAGRCGGHVCWNAMHGVLG